MDTILSKAETLQRTARQLLFLGEDDQPIYTDDFSRLNREIYEQINALYRSKGKTVEEEAAICIALLMGYSACLYGNAVDESKKQNILNRAWRVLDLLPSSLLKCRLLTYCYGEVYQEDLAGEAHEIIRSWENRELSPEEKEVVETLQGMEECPYPHYNYYFPQTKY